MDDHEILMAPFFKRARAEGLWFYTRYQQLWFSPDELEKENTNGCLRWGPMNWELRDPKQKLQECEDAVKKAVYNLESIKKRMGIIS